MCRTILPKTSPCLLSSLAESAQERFVWVGFFYFSFWRLSVKQLWFVSGLTYTEQRSWGSKWKRSLQEHKDLLKSLMGLGLSQRWAWGVKPSDPDLKGQRNPYPWRAGCTDEEGGVLFIVDILGVGINLSPKHCNARKIRYLPKHKYILEQNEDIQTHPRTWGQTLSVTTSSEGFPVAGPSPQQAAAQVPLPDRNNLLVMIVLPTYSCTQEKNVSW